MNIMDEKQCEKYCESRDAHTFCASLTVCTFYTIVLMSQI